MFKKKEKPVNKIRNTIIENGGMIAGKIIDGMKYASHWNYALNKRNLGLFLLKNRLQKKPSAGILAIAGIGLLIFGIANLSRK